jgi:creatinine amidohydrolase
VRYPLEQRIFQLVSQFADPLAEQHGPHLPLGTDWFNADRAARQIAEELNAYLLPALPISNAQEHLDFKGSVSIRPQTLALVLEEIILSLAHQGFKKFVLVNAHGGNWVLKPTVRDINFRHPDLVVIMSHGVMPGDKNAIPPEIHAGGGETGALMSYRPELVKEGAEDFTPNYGREYMDYVGMKPLTPTGVWGTSKYLPADAAPVRASIQARSVATARMRFHPLRLAIPSRG